MENAPDAVVNFTRQRGYTRIVIAIDSLLNGQQHGVQCEDRSVHPEQRPVVSGQRVRADDGVRGRLPAPRRYGRVSFSASELPASSGAVWKFGATVNKLS